TTALAAAGAGLADVFYVRMPGPPPILAWRLKPAYDPPCGEYWIDEPYDPIRVRPHVVLSQPLLRVVAPLVVDGVVNGAATAVTANGQLWRYVQDGNVQHYALVFLGGVIAVLAFLVR